MDATKVPFGYRDVSPEEKRQLVSRQFDEIAATYDRADTVLSAGLDARWRRQAIALLGLGPGETVLDLCGGTGGLALLAAAETGPGGRVVICDFNLAMMETGKARIGRGAAGQCIRFLQGEAERLALAGGRWTRSRSVSACGISWIPARDWPRCTGCSSPGAGSSSWNSRCRGDGGSGRSTMSTRSGSCRSPAG